MNAPEFVRTGWACVTEAMMGGYVAIEGTTDADMVPVVFPTREEAEIEREDYIRSALDARREDHDPEDLGAEFEDLDALLDAERASLEAEEFVAFVGIDRAGDVFELDPESLQVYRPLRRPDR